MSSDKMPLPIQPDLFRQYLFAWAAAHPRPMPWKGVRDPYRIWLSEVILQQTRVEQGLPYYERFIAAYPTVTDLANAPDEEVFKKWEGLGYYSRARNLLATARVVASALNGQFPTDYAGIRALRGVGDYTAAAIASFAYDLPYAVVDGNVYRILSRIFGIETPTDTPAGKRAFAALAQELLDTSRAAAYNQAMMDFGATHCTPRNPQCVACPFSEHCVAFLTGAVAEFPRKEKKMIKKARVFVYLVIHYKGDTFLRQQTEKDIWQDLFTPPWLETDVEDAQNLTPDALADIGFEQLGAAWQPFRGPTRIFRQTLTHRVVTGIFVSLHLPDNWPEERLSELPLTGCTRVSRQSVRTTMAVPRLVEWYLEAENAGYSLF